MTDPRLPTADEIGLFVASLPSSYAQKYSSQSIMLHMAVAAQRGSRPVSVGLLADSPQATSALCVIAEDRPGLLATISGALVLCGLDVIDAEAYTRKLDAGKFEALDLFWVRRQGQNTAQQPAVDDADARRLQTMLNDVLLGKQRFPTLPPLEITTAPPLQQSDTRVRFIDEKGGGLGTLEVETGDRSGLLWMLSRALFEHNVQILTSQVTTRNGRVFDRFTVVELDGSPINELRRLEIQVAVLGAIEPARRRPSQAAPAQL